jgi:NAD(P)-dependent dehydrogenase (short-subunit alcohol dehydrogenase family)
MDCKGKVAIVTGGAGNGIGRSVALTLARDGAKVIVNYNTNHLAAEAVVHHIRSRRACAVGIQADIFTAAGCKKLVDQTLAQFGQIDICVIGPGGGWNPQPLDMLDPTAALADLHKEVAPFYHLLPLILPGMYTRNWGRWVAIASNLDRPSPSYSYNAAKAARLQALLMAQEQAWAHHVTMNVVSPGPVNPISGLETAVELCDHGPNWQQRREVTPQDIAEGIVFLCSDAGKYITGSVMPYSFD